MDVCTIYLIRNLINQKPYVGQTWETIEKRFYRHCRCEGCPKLYNAIQKYGMGNFSIEPILSTWNQEDADYYEDFFIRLYDSIKNGYNIREGGSRGKHTEETKKKLSIINRGHPPNSGSFQLGISNNVGSDNPLSKLDDAKVIDIKRLLQDGIEQEVIANLYDVTSSVISNINRNHSWTHIPWPNGIATKSTPKLFQPGDTKNIGSGNPMAKLTEEQVIQIKQMLTNEVGQRDIANQFNVSYCCIGDIRRGTRWKQVPWPNKTKP